MLIDTQEIPANTISASPDISPRSGPANSGDITFIDLFDLFGKKRKVIIGGALGGAVGALIIAFLLPVMFTGTTVIMPPQQQQSAASAMLGQLGSLASMAGHDMGMKSPGDLYVGILKSQSVASFIINRFDLKRVYKVHSLSDATDILAGRSKIVSGLDSLIKISVDDRDPKRAAALANAYVDALFALNNRLALTEAGQRRAFFEKQIESEKLALSSAELSFKKLQQRTGLLQLGGQVEMTLSSLTEVKAQIAAHEVMLQTLRQSATDQNPEVIREQAELAALKAQQAKLASTNTNGSDPLLALSKVPETGLDYLRAVREVKYHEALFELLAKEYETARLDEARESAMIQVVDQAIPPDHKSSPHRLFVLIVGVMLGTLLTALYCIWDQARLNARLA